MVDVFTWRVVGHDEIVYVEDLFDDEEDLEQHEVAVHDVEDMTLLNFKDISYLSTGI